MFLELPVLSGRSRRPRVDRPRLAESGPSRTPPGIEAQELQGKRGVRERASSPPERLLDFRFRAKAARAATGKELPCRAGRRCRRILPPGSKGGVLRIDALRCKGRPPGRGQSATARPDF